MLKDKVIQTKLKFKIQIDVSFTCYAAIEQTQTVLMYACIIKL